MWLKDLAESHVRQLDLKWYANYKANPTYSVTSWKKDVSCCEIFFTNTILQEEYSVPLTEQYHYLQCDLEMMFTKKDWFDFLFVTSDPASKHIIISGYLRCTWSKFHVSYTESLMTRLSFPLPYIGDWRWIDDGVLIRTEREVEILRRISRN